MSPSHADQVPFRIVDTGWQEHSSRGGGVFILYQFDRRPDDSEDALKSFAQSECNRVAPKAVQMVLAKLGKSDPDFVAMEFRFGGSWGTYIKFYGRFENGVCVDLD
jgi:hypothetical protein